ncbi:hypothetical protein E5675_18935 [Sphingopyxis sp. PAMC25046]|uniref:hypothetical protein n=1 Tax=Sphingopyxis sp. PAMC25046 TaxID=2565556 RepID=UPI00109DE8FA|nr:hypothetical protein [Sphingopyxis sp. PAMC25046]QCB56301.1 hypothetical protein E5675_18935 [Sphingopyxis sp. PAMC25046]
MMIRLTASLTALALFSTAAAAQGIDINSAAAIGSNSFGEYVRAFPAGADNSPKAVLARLNQLCASDRPSDQQRCEKAWRMINRAHADLQARRAAEAAAASHSVTN